jgi:hypothetical protein
MAQILDLGKLRFNWAGAYSPSTEYEYNDVVKYGANLYAYTGLNPATAVVPTTTANWTLVIEGIRFRGVYSEGVVYYVNDIVVDQYSTFIVIEQHTALSPDTDVEELQIIAVGQQGIPAQENNAGKVLTTDGDTPEWTGTVELDIAYVGEGQGAQAIQFETDADLSDTLSVFAATSPNFVQLAIANLDNDTSSSTDFIAYTADGTNEAGWIDMGITSREFDAEQYGITGPHDGYIFMSGPKIRQTAITTKAVAAQIATLTTELAHGYVTGDKVEISGVGVGINGRRTVINAPTATTFRVSVPGVSPLSSTELEVFGAAFSPLGSGNLVLATDLTGLDNKIIFAAGGFSTGRTQMEITPDVNVHIEIETPSVSSGTGALTVAGGVGISGDVNIEGDLTMEGSLNLSGSLDYSGVDLLPIGAGAFAFSQDLTNPVLVVQTDADDYAQIAFRNTSNAANASTDIIVYANNGTDDAGWIDLGITSSAFADPEFTITGINDGYIFYVAPEGTAGEGNLVIATGDTGGDNSIVFAAGGLASNNAQMKIVPDETVHIDIDTDSTNSETGALTVAGGAGFLGSVSIEGLIRVDGASYLGDGAEAFNDDAELTNANVVVQLSGTPYAQLAVHNDTPNASTDIIVYSDNGTDTSGWIDMGITGSTFSQAEFGITGPNDGYIFFEAPDDTDGAGNLVFATGDKGSENKIIFAAGGFASGTTQMEITPDVNVHIEIPTESTSPATGAFTVVGGVGVQGDMNVQGNVSIEGTITFAGGGTTVETENLAVTNPIIFVGNANAADIVDLAVIGEYVTSVTPVAATATNKALTSNVATITTDTAHGFVTGDVVTIAGVDATFNGVYTITAAPTTTTFTFNKTNTNVSSAPVTPTGTATVNGKRRFAGLSRDASDGITKFFRDATTRPVTAVNFSEPGLSFAPIKTGALETVGNIDTSGNITINGTVVDNKHAATVEFVRTAIGGNWTERTANYAVAGGESIWANTTGGAFTVTLPANPIANFDRIRIADIAGVWANTPVVVARNGRLIQGLAEDLSLNVRNASIELIYSGPTYGWRLV